MLSDPFATLGLAPTQDVAAIKRAYFAALAKHPPHKDAEAFRRVREAYERLSDPRSCALEFPRAPVHAVAELARFDAQWGERIERSARNLRAQQSNERAVASFVERVSRMTFTEARLAQEKRG